MRLTHMLLMLHTQQIPDVGGDTQFGNMTKAFDEMPVTLKNRIENKMATFRYGGVRVTGQERLEKADRGKPPVPHPAIRTHPETGQRTIYTNRSFVREIEGCTPEESAEIVGHLERQIMNPSVQCRIRWSVDTFVMWDNRAVQHFATDDFWPETRHVERVTVVGDAPF